MNELQIFNSEEFGDIRTATIENEPWFVGKDVATALGYAKPLNALSAHVEKDDSLKQGITDSLGREKRLGMQMRKRLILKTSIGLSVSA